MTIVFIVLTALACAALVYLQRIDVAGAAAVAKLLASSGFIATTISAGALGHRFGRVMVVGFVLSWIGDFFLIGAARQTFLLGLASFLAAHLAYMTAFVIHGQDRRWLAFASFPLILVALGVSAWLAPHVPAELVVPVRAYTVVITLMVIMAFGARGAGAPGIIVLGALFFFGSDLSVAALRIVGTDFPTYVWGLPMYYAGQLCLAVGAGQHDT